MLTYNLENKNLIEIDKQIFNWNISHARSRYDIYVFNLWMKNAFEFDVSWPI